MTNDTFAPLDIGAQWGRLNETIIALVDCIPEEKLDWSPREELWNFQGILTHTVMTRDGWLGSFVGDGGPTFDDADAFRAFVAGMQTKAEIQNELRRSWERVQRFLADPAKLDAVYEGSRGGQERRANGHWVAFHLLEHDIHHRADVFHYLALLGIEHPAVDTP